jgi:hypothetical protein
MRPPPDGSRAGRRNLLPDDLHHHPLPALPVELGVKDGLPRPEVEPAPGDRDDDLVVREQVLQMGVAVRFAGAVVAASLSSSPTAVSYTCESFIEE